MATITEARASLREKSGRFDLTALQLNDYLNRGQRFLDEITEFKKAPARYQVTIMAGQVIATFPVDLRVVQHVWCADTEDRWPLQKAGDQWIRQTFAVPQASLERDKPIYYVPDPLTYKNASGIYLYDAVEFDDSLTLSGIMVLPPPDGTYYVEVEGRFYSPTLTDLQSSWWLTNKDSLLVQAALRELETDYRNTQGIKDWEAAMSPSLKGIQDDLAEEEWQDIDQMEG